MTNPQEKRKAERISTERPVKIKYDHTEGNGKMLDLSVIGAGFLTNDEIEENEELCIGFVLPTYNKAMYICGLAKHASKIRNQYLVGVEFTDISDYDQTQISKFIAYHHRLDNL